MTLRLHHCFVCSSVGAPEAELLLNAGLVEGSPNIHPGQGTANRRFFCKRGYLELLWVHDEQEARSPLAAQTNLWDRWVARGKSANPFGLCFSSPQDLDSELPFTTWAYRPHYLPEGRAILFADQLRLSEPEIFVLSWPQGQSPPESEPKDHPLGLFEMHSVSVGLPDPSAISEQLNAIRNARLLKIHCSDTPELAIEFTSRQKVQRHFPALGLSFIGQPTNSTP